ncbi:glycosyltransferase family 2 protein [Massilia litorea]|uniref:Glycosyltransferase n=1 Tax=Massilia litorea TaxID=2769491 RepID=A0A7L9U169_9BURK|nr:glycosyltransferase family 2 protein [Massilia litorea]QOL48149.1 glycosyltransferase [Massilia litorea]
MDPSTSSTIRVSVRSTWRSSASAVLLCGPCACLPAHAGTVAGLADEQAGGPALLLANTLLLLIVAAIFVYACRHLIFSLSRMFGRQRHPYLDIDCAEWPQITVFIAAHNEEKVVAGCIEALLETDYPQDRLKIVPVNDRSTDDTRRIIDTYVKAYPDRVVPFHRTSGKAGKAAAIKDALAHAEGDIIIIFDADYTPGRGLLRQLAAPFFDPEVGAVMGRVVPVNASTNLLTRLLDLERAGGYQVDQQARMNLRLIPQFGGTVGGLRVSAVEQVGGFRDDTLAEDTDITYRLVCRGWNVVYSNRSECYEEVPEEWSVRIKQIMRWSKGHNQVLVRYWSSFLFSDCISLRARVDGFLLLFVFAMPPVLLFGWILALLCYMLSSPSLLSLFVAAWAFSAYGANGSFAAFFEIAIAVILDGNRKRLRLLPLSLLGFCVSLVVISRASWQLLADSIRKRELVWDKTVRYRKAAGAPAERTP